MYVIHLISIQLLPNTELEYFLTAAFKINFIMLYEIPTHSRTDWIHSSHSVSLIITLEFMIAKFKTCMKKTRTYSKKQIHHGLYLPESEKHQLLSMWVMWFTQETPPV